MAERQTEAGIKTNVPDRRRTIAWWIFGFYVVCGLLALTANPALLSLALLAFIPGTIALLAINRWEEGCGPTVLIWTFWALATLGVLRGCLPPGGRPIEFYQMRQCQTRMHNLGIAMLLYAQSHEGHFPPNLQVLLQYMVDTGQQLSDAAQDLFALRRTTLPRPV